MCPTESDRSQRTGYSSANDGTGFGLAIVQRLAEAHEWDITLTESEAGGVRFEFSGIDIQ